MPQVNIHGASGGGGGTGGPASGPGDAAALARALAGLARHADNASASLEELKKAAKARTTRTAADTEQRARDNAFSYRRRSEDLEYRARKKGTDLDLKAQQTKLAATNRSRDLEKQQRDKSQKDEEATRQRTFAIRRRSVELETRQRRDADRAELRTTQLAFSVRRRSEDLETKHRKTEERAQARGYRESYQDSVRVLTSRRRLAAEEARAQRQSEQSERRANRESYQDSVRVLTTRRRIAMAEDRGYLALRREAAGDNANYEAVSRNTRSSASWMNANEEAKKRSADRLYKAERSLAEHMNRDYDVRTRMASGSTAASDRASTRSAAAVLRADKQLERQKDRDYLKMRREADLLNSNYDLINRSARANATSTNANANYVASGQRANANAMNANRTYVASGQRANANAMNANANYVASGQRANANAMNANANYISSGQWANARAMNANYNAVTAAKGKAYDAMRKDADRMNRDFDLIAGRRMPGVYGAAGRGAASMFGGDAIMWGGGLKFAAKLAEDVIMAPFWIGNKANQIMAASRPYTDLRLGTSAIGRGGNFDSLAFQDSMFPGRVGSGRSAATPAWMTALQLQPLDVVNMMQAYGISPRTAEQATGIAQSIGGANLQPYLGGLGREQYAAYGKFAGTLGLTGTNPADQQRNLDSYFTKLQAVTATAVGMGLDRSQSISNVQSLLSQAASSGSLNLGGGERQVSFWANMAGSGLGSMRTGEGQLSMMAGANQATAGAGLGGDPVATVGLQRYINKTLGGRLPTSEADVESLLGAGVFRDTQATDTGKAMIAQVIAAGKAGQGLAVQEYLKPIISSNTSLQMQIAQSSFGAMGGPIWGPISASRAGGVTLPQYTAWQTNPAAPMPSWIGETVAPSDQSVMKQLSGVADTAIQPLMGAASATGLPAGLLAAVTGRESSYGRNLSDSSTGAVGLMQVEPGTYREMAQKYGLPLNGARDPKSNALAGAYYLKEMLAESGGQLVPALEKYNMGPGAYAKATGPGGSGVPAAVQEYAYRAVQDYHSRSQPGNTFPEFGPPNATQGQINTVNGQTSFNVAQTALSGDPGDVIIHFTTGLSEATAGLQYLASAALSAGHNLIHTRAAPDVGTAPGPHALPPIWSPAGAGSTPAKP